ncbi:hypothetical protein [Bifidobacterium asteroides]|nr:hypothetical protein [Bifidobacterium asteroides]
MGKRTKWSEPMGKIRGFIRKKGGRTQTSQQTHKQGQQMSEDQKQQLQWTLEQTQLRYNELQDKHDKQMDLAVRLLGFGAISGFAAFLSYSTSNSLTGRLWVVFVFFIILLFSAMFIAVLVLCKSSIQFSWDDEELQDITKLNQKQSKEEKTTSLIETLSAQIETLRESNANTSMAIYAMYVMYTLSLVVLVLIIIFSH